MLVDIAVYYALQLLLGVEKVTFALAAAPVVAEPSSLAAAPSGLGIEVDLGVRLGWGHGGGQGELSANGTDSAEASSATGSVRWGCAVGAVSSWLLVSTSATTANRRRSRDTVECPARPPGPWPKRRDRLPGAPGRLGPWRSPPRTRPRWPVSALDLDQPVFDGAGATKGDLVAYLDAVHERMLPELRDRALSVVRARLRPAGVHAEEPAEVRPRLDPDDDGVGERLQARGALPGLRRPADAASGWPTSGRSSTTRRWCASTATGRPT